MTWPPPRKIASGASDISVILNLVLRMAGYGQVSELNRKIADSRMQIHVCECHRHAPSKMGYGKTQGAQQGLDNWVFG